MEAQSPWALPSEHWSNYGANKNALSSTNHLKSKSIWKLDFGSNMRMTTQVLSFARRVCSVATVIVKLLHWSIIESVKFANILHFENKAHTKIMSKHISLDVNVKNLQIIIAMILSAWHSVNGSNMWLVLTQLKAQEVDPDCQPMFDLIIFLIFTFRSSLLAQSHLRHFPFHFLLSLHFSISLNLN